MSNKKYYEEELYQHHNERKPLNFTDILILSFFALVALVPIAFVLTKLMSLAIKLFPAHA